MNTFNLDKLKRTSNIEPISSKRYYIMDIQFQLTKWIKTKIPVYSDQTNIEIYNNLLFDQGHDNDI